MKLLARELAGVEYVSWLGVLEHHVSGGVNDIADRAHSCRSQAALHPIGARPHLHSCNGDGDEAAAQVGDIDGDIDELARRRLDAFDVRGHEVRFEFAAGRRSELARDTNVAEAVRAVGCDLGLEDRVGRDVLRQRLARLTAIEKHDLRFAILSEQQLVRRAQHPLARFARDLRVANERTAGDARAWKRNRHKGAGHRVRCAGDDLDHLSAADVDLMDPERLVRARVVLLLEHAADDDRGQVEDLDRFDLGA